MSSDIPWLLLYIYKRKNQSQGTHHLHQISENPLPFNKPSEKLKESREWIMACWSAENATKAYLSTLKMVSIHYSLTHVSKQFLPSFFNPSHYIYLSSKVLYDSMAWSDLSVIIFFRVKSAKSQMWLSSYQH